MFYDNFLKLCEKNKVSRTRACTDCGVSRTAWRKWESGATPNGSTLNTLAAYFDVSVGYLLGSEQKKEAAIDVVDSDLQEYLDELRNRPEKRMLFSVTKNATKDQIEAIVKMIEAMQGEGDSQ